MKQRLLFIFCLIFSASVIAGAQTRTVTNADLEKFKQARLRAEADMRDNYDRLGFPSPEVMAARDEESARVRAELIERLREERLEGQRLAMELEIARRMSNSAMYRGNVRQSPYDVEANLEIGRYGDGGYYSGGAFPGGGYSNRRGFRTGRQQTQTGYFAGGQFWPQGNRTPPRPLIATPRSTRRQ